VTILDACVLINLINGKALDVVLKLVSHEFAVGPQVRTECANQYQVLDAAFQDTLHLIDDSDIPASVYLRFLAKYELGLGETECLTTAFIKGANVCTDDQRARKMCQEVLGSHRVYGSARLLRETVQAGLLSSVAAINSYELMRKNGAFLPRLPIAYFES
jgi:predicted nucleic acid-binding protein